MPRVKALCWTLPKLDVSSSAVRSPPHITPTSFKKFPLLPRELRDQIWECAAQFPRQIRLRTLVLKEHYATADNWHVPGILHANRESREWGLKHYELVNERIGLKKLNMLTRGVYVNFKLDHFIHPPIPFSITDPRYSFISYLQIFAGLEGYNFGAAVMEKIQNLDFPYPGSDKPKLERLERILTALAKANLKKFRILYGEKAFPRPSDDGWFDSYGGLCHRVHAFITHTRTIVAGFDIGRENVEFRFDFDVDRLAWSPV